MSLTSSLRLHGALSPCNYTKRLLAQSICHMANSVTCAVMDEVGS